MSLERLRTDILILGSGGAGLFAALHALKANPDLDVTVASKGLLGKCGCTRMVQARPIRRLEEHRAVALIPATDGALAGVLMIDIRTGAFRFVAAQAVLLATGGGPTLYRYHTPSGDKSMDGLAMALRAGLPLRAMWV